MSTPAIEKWQIGHFVGTWPRLLASVFGVAVLLAFASRKEFSDIAATGLAWLWVPVCVLVLASRRFGRGKLDLMRDPPPFSRRLFFGSPRRVVGSVLVVASLGNLLTGNPLQGLLFAVLFFLLVLGKRAKRLPKLIRKPF